jgi:aminoglycoside 6'-N-acetyltransferase
MLRGERVYLRPVRQEDLPFFAAHANDIAFLTEYNFFGLQRHDRLEKRFQEDGLLSQEHTTLAVVTCDGDQLVGDVSYRKVRYGGDGSGAYDLGIVLAPEQRGKGYGVEAQQLLAEYLFSISPIMRVEASTDITNRAEQRALEKAGFSREGVLRRAQWRNGDWHDLVVYSKLRGE